MPMMVALTMALAVGVTAAPTPLIFDTDMCGDCDDVLALARDAG